MPQNPGLLQGETQLPTNPMLGPGLLISNSPDFMQRHPPRN